MTNQSRYFWLFDRMAEIEFKPQQIAVLFVLLVRDDMGGEPLTKAELGALIGVKERQVSTILKELQDELKLIEKQRRGGNGKGRVANTYIVRPDATGNPVPETWRRQAIADSGNQQSSTGNPVPAKTSNQQSAAASVSGNEAPVACEESPSRENKHAPARGNTKLITTSLSEFNPETPEASFESVAREMPEGGGNLDLDWMLSAKHRAFANERGFLNGSCDELFGQFLDRCTTHGPRLSVGWGAEWRKWVRNQVKFDAERERRANQTPEANHVQRTYAPAAAAGRTNVRAKGDPVFDRLLEDLDEPDDQPLDLGRLESHPI